MSESPKAVFLSYASQDAEAAKRIAESLRAAGVEVWFDQNELVGGDAWDAKIRRQIAECALFVPVISASTQARLEGYFRIEWKIAARRTHAMAAAKAFLLPVVIDATRDAEAHVPDEFREVQWMRIAAGGSATPFANRVKQLVEGHSPRHETSAPARPVGPRPSKSPFFGPAGLAAIVLVIGVAGYFGWRAAMSGEMASPLLSAGDSATPRSAPAAEKSIAVLPLENLSPEVADAYFSEGMHAEIIAAISRLPDLKVISRASLLRYRDSKLSLAQIGRELGVANVITGSVRRAGGQVRIQLELRRCADEALLWAPAFERVLKDSLGVQNEIAAQVARTLQLREVKSTTARARFETENIQAFELYLRAMALYGSDADLSLQKVEELCVLLAQAVALDPRFFSAVRDLSGAHVYLWMIKRDERERAWHAVEAKKWAAAAVALDPASGEGSMANYLLNVERDLVQGVAAAERFLRFMPNDWSAHFLIGGAHNIMGKRQVAALDFQRALELSPNDLNVLSNLLGISAHLRRPQEFAAYYQKYVAAGGEDVGGRGLVAGFRFVLYGEIPADLGKFSPNQQISWLLQGRRFDEALSAAEKALTGANLSAFARADLLRHKAEALRRLDRIDESAAAGAAAHALIGESDKPNTWEALRRRILILEAAQKTEQALALARAQVLAYADSDDAMRRWSYETLLARLLARTGRTSECLGVLRRLIGAPSGLTVPMLRIDPDWDNLRSDPDFKALLADPRNSAPL